MYACSKGYIDIARMLVIEYNANFDIQNTVRAIRYSSISLFASLFSMQLTRWVLCVVVFQRRLRVIL